MGQKVHPVGYRLGVIRDWESRWYADKKNFAKQLHEDIKLRKWIKDRWGHAGISTVEIERIGNVIRFTIWTARPGVVIGKGGSEIQEVRDELQKMTGSKVMINVQEIKNPDKNAQIVAEGIASALERRVSFRRAMKQAIFRAMKAGALGIKTQCSGRLGGAEIARREWYLEGRLPLSTLRADIDYGFAEAKTMYGVIGVKVWIYNGDVLPSLKEQPHDEVSSERR
ncbi:SSU ribosomal protein S3P [Acetomicrobium thermoterrenum DSM 13490]|jgi:small subunit ribosomal protein S3|uniref:Small ribosomal subunit protein uS3 n=2 Tax=Acetomicrobium TaxID=49894 RepID=A0A0T5XBU7_9BACT|nr:MULTISPECIES: 30S ribosomal protein S3 [Acetomicrobium]KRT35817.1 ribosomal protein S3 [Acetomicrobium hydrogeniformans ATCC BAA-1850]SDX64917.1 SSU ribosomal protein S3P [Acetomicrobium thermoterrenum DSM 13490]